jgi:membrane protein
VKKYLSDIGKYSGWQGLVSLSKRWRFPGHRGISLYEVIAFLFKEMRRDDIMQRSASVSFSLFVSLFPTLLVAFTLIPFLPITAFQNTVMTTMQQVMPHDVFQLLQSTIEDIVMRHRADILSISLVLAIYYSTRGVLSLMGSFDKALPTFHKRTFWQKQGVAFKITGLLSLLFLFSIALIIGGELIVHKVMSLFDEEKDEFYIWLTIFRWVIIVLVYFFSISLIYYYGPAKHERWRFFSAGSTLATVLLLLISLLYSWLINQFGQYNKLYGSIGTLLVTQIWIYYNALGLLVGFELNASIEMNENKLISEQKIENKQAIIITSEAENAEK